MLRCVSLQPSRVSEYSLFPGQIVKAVAANPKGSQLLATKIACDASPPLPSRPDKITAGQPPLSVVSAAGPYTTSDNLAYEPLADLLKYLSSHKPHLAILAGPFVDCKHDLIAGGATEEAFQDTFKRVVAMIVDVAKSIPATQASFITYSPVVFPKTKY